MTRSPNAKPGSLTIVLIAPDQPEETLVRPALVAEMVAGQDAPPPAWPPPIHRERDDTQVYV
jgi:hypothetical protein